MVCYIPSESGKASVYTAHPCLDIFWVCMLSGLPGICHSGIPSPVERPQRLVRQPHDHEGLPRRTHRREDTLCPRTPWQACGNTHGLGGHIPALPVLRPPDDRCVHRPPSHMCLGQCAHSGSCVDDRLQTRTARSGPQRSWGRSSSTSSTSTRTPRRRRSGPPASPAPHLCTSVARRRGHIVSREYCYLVSLVIAPPLHASFQPRATGLGRRCGCPRGGIHG